MACIMVLPHQGVCCGPCWRMLIDCAAVLTHTMAAYSHINILHISVSFVITFYNYHFLFVQECWADSCVELILALSCCCCGHSGSHSASPEYAFILHHAVPVALQKHPDIVHIPCSPTVPLCQNETVNQSQHHMVWQDSQQMLRTRYRIGVIFFAWCGISLESGVTLFLKADMCGYRNCCWLAAYTLFKS